MSNSKDDKKSNFKKISNSWIVVRHDATGAIAKAWASIVGEDKIVTASGGSAATILQRVEEARGTVINIPTHYLCFPTGMDIHTHLRYPGQEHKETLTGALEAAFMGGYDCVVNMPNTDPVIDEISVFEKTAADIKSVSKDLPPVGVLLTGAGTIGLLGKKATEIKKLVQKGAVAITNDGRGVPDDKIMKSIFKACAQNGVPYLQHAEFGGHGGVASASDFQHKHDLKMYPRTAESEMVHRDLVLLEQFKNVHYHVQHIATAESVELIKRYKENGFNVTCEVTPHHLLFSNEDIPDQTTDHSAFFKMNPPLFSPADKKALQVALASGVIDCVATDHAPHEIKLKSCAWSDAAFGTRGLETALPVIGTLISQGALSYDRAVEVFSESPRKIISVPEYKKHQGYVFINLKEQFQVNESDLPGISSNSCFLGQKLKGKIELRVEPGAIYVRD